VDNETLGVGRDGEEAALAWYRSRGYSVVARNWRCPLGEIDLLVGRAGELVVCEVKSRRGTRLGGPFEAVGRRKQRKLRLLAQAFLAATGARPATVRFDVASVLLPAAGSASVHIFEHAF
jgi:putative endonuclease